LANGHVEVVDTFVYLGCMTDSSDWWQQRGSPALDWLSSVLYEYVGEEDLEFKHQAGLLETKLRLYQTYIVPVLMYGCETWATTKYLLSRLDAFDTWALRKILRIPYTRHVSNAEVIKTTALSPGD